MPSYVSAIATTVLKFCDAIRWRIPTNVFRTTWSIHNVPTLVRYQRVDGDVKETGRLVEGEILVEQRLKHLLSR